MKVLKLLTLLTMFMLFSTSVFATNIGFNYANVAGESGWGLTADTEFSISDKLQADLAFSGQNTGSLYRGKITADLGVPVGNFEIAVSSETKLVGYALDDLGRDSSLGLKATANVGKVGVIIGLYGSNAGDFGSPNAHDILVEQHKFDPLQLVDKGLDTLTAPSNTLSIKDGSRVNLRLGLETKLFNDRAEVYVSARPEIGADENPVHQAILGVRTGFDVSETVQVIWQGELGVQTWEGDVQHETTNQITVNIVF